MKLLKKLFPAISIALVACASVPPPQGEACVANVRSNYNLCFDMTKDFDSNGSVLATSKGIRRPLDFQNRINFDPDSYASLKAYLLKIRDRCKSGGCQ